MKYSPNVISADSNSAVWLSGIFPIQEELVLTRFGNWESILDLPTVPAEDSSVPQYLHAISLYSRTLASLWTGDLVESKTIYTLFQEVAASVPLDFFPVEHAFYPYHKVRKTIP